MSNLKVAIYCRVSTEEQDASKQEALCREYCQRLGYNIYAVYTDNAISGTKTSRPAFDEMLKEMRQFKFNAIMVTRLDRIGRSLKHLLTLIEEFANKGVQFIAITQNIDTTSSIGKFQLQVMGAFAEFERNIISERTKEGLRYAKNVGKRGRDKRPRIKRGRLRKLLAIREG